MSTSDNSQATEIRSYLSKLFKPEELIEYRALLWGGGARALYFTNLDRLADVVARLDQDPRIQSSYVVINPLKGRLIRERGLTVNPTDEQVAETISGPGGQSAKDGDVDRLTKIFIDCDTVRAPHLRESNPAEYSRLQKEPASDEEKAKTKEVAKAVRAYLTELGWPSPLVCDSGNGYHLLYLINLTNTSHNYNIVADCLKSLKARFDCADMHIDGSVYNPARLTRAYGSTTRKGTDTPERPYRRNLIFEPRGPVLEVPFDLLLRLATDSPGFGKRGDDEMPELDPSFVPLDYIEFFEKQGAWEVVGEKEWQGNPILATSVCLYAGHHHSGDEYKSGFIIGDTFGYKCFSDDCEGHTIKDIYKWLREETNDDGSLKFVPWPKPIYKTETFEELKEAFGIVDLNEVDKEHEAESAAQSVDASQPEPLLKPGEPEVNKNRVKSARVADLAGWMISAILRDPEEVLPKFRQLKQRIEHTINAHIEAPIQEAIGCILGYFEDTHLLPNKGELLSWIEESTHPAIQEWRKKEYFGDVSPYIRDLQDDPSKEFTAVVTELDRATLLAAQRKSTKKNWDKHLHEINGDGNVQAFRIAERQHAQKELRSNGEIVGKPLQMVTELISEEFLKDIDGSNDAGKVELGFPAIDEHSHIGLNGERTICIYGPANVGKTTLLMTIAINMAMKGKNVLILIGEHQAIPMMKTLTLMIGPTVKDDPEIGVLPDRTAWESINRTATMEDWERLNKLLEKLKGRLILPGWMGVENISAIAGTDEDRLGACIDTIHSFHMTYPLDAVIIDPLDQVMPLSVMGKDNAWKEGEEVLHRIQGLSRNFEGREGKGLMVITSVQFTSKMQREIEKNQAKTAIGDSMDDVILSLMEQTSQIQFYTTIPQTLDTMIGIVTRLKGGTDGYLVKGRFRYGSSFKMVSFVMDPAAHIITTKGVATYVAPTARAAAAPDGHNVVEQSMEPYDTL